MIKKLRTKFIVINMAIVLLLLSVIFVLVYHSTKLNLENDSIRTMKSIAATSAMHLRPSDIADDVRLPFFVLRLSRNGAIVAAEGGFFDLSDRDFLEDIVSQVLASSSPTGTFPEYHLRFFRLDTPGSQVLVFADTTSERATLDSLIETCLLIEALGLIAFLCVSFYLSKWATAPIEKAWTQQKQFVADASHELKTPLTVITTNAELLQQPDTPPQQEQSFVSNILTTSKQMRTLLEQMLELARSDSEQADGHREELDLSLLISDEAMTYESVLFEQGFSLSYDIEDGIRISGIDTHIRHLADILLDNAGKYTVPGGRVRLELRTSGKKHCLLTVSNEGPPISREDLKNIFKRFYRADPAHSRTGSYGLGLAIAQNIAEQHRGKIWAESSDGINTFYTELPIL